MGSFGKSIRIYLKDGTVTGIKFGEIVNQTIQSVSCPRLRTGDLFNYSQSKKPGVYFLFGEDDESAEPKVYIGEAESILDRLQSHIITKDFWNEVVFFTSKDENLTKSHVKYLESRLIQTALKTKRYKVDNYNQSQPSSLPLADRDAMEEILLYIKLLTGVFGHKFLEEVVSTSNRTLENRQIKLEHRTTSVENSDNLILFLNVSGLQAKAYQTEEGIVVLEGSEAAKDIMNSLSNGYRDMRAQLIHNGSLKLINEKYIFQKDILFNSASPAAAIIVGYSINGPYTWKNSSGTSLREIEKLKMEKIS